MLVVEEVARLLDAVFARRGGGVTRQRFLKKRTERHNGLVRGLAASAVGFVLLTATSCGGNAKYAGLTRGEATRLAKTKIEAQLDTTKRPYYEISIWNVAAERGRIESGAPVWLIGFWNGQSDSGDCALARRADGRTHVRLVSCAMFPRYTR